MEAEVEFDPIDRQLKKLTDHAVDHKSKIVSMNKEMTKEFVIVKKQLTEMDERLKEMDERLTEMDERFLGQFSEMGRKIDALADLLRKE